MQHILGYRCTLCGAELPYTERMTCPHCGEKGILDIILIMPTSKRTCCPGRLSRLPGQ